MVSLFVCRPSCKVKWRSAATWVLPWSSRNSSLRRASPSSEVWHGQTTHQISFHLLARSVSFTHLHVLSPSLSLSLSLTHSKLALVEYYRQLPRLTDLLKISSKVYTHSNLSQIRKRTTSFSFSSLPFDLHSFKTFRFLCWKSVGPLMVAYLEFYDQCYDHLSDWFWSEWWVVVGVENGLSEHFFFFFFFNYTAHPYQTSESVVFSELSRRIGFLFMFGLAPNIQAVSNYWYCDPWVDLCDAFDKIQRNTRCWYPDLPFSCIIFSMSNPTPVEPNHPGMANMISHNSWLALCNPDWMLGRAWGRPHLCMTALSPLLMTCINTGNAWVRVRKGARRERDRDELSLHFWLVAIDLAGKLSSQELSVWGFLALVDLLHACVDNLSDMYPQTVRETESVGLVDGVNEDCLGVADRPTSHRCWPSRSAFQGWLCLDNTSQYRCWRWKPTELSEEDMFTAFVRVWLRSAAWS